MREQIIATADPDGFPYAEVPPSRMWDLVEYISFHRVAVICSYHEPNFTVTFARSDLETAQRILDEWEKVESRELQLAQ
jgi:hypothetical protein